MARRSDHSRDEIKQMALQAAEHIVADKGSSALTARRLASGIGYTVGSLYLVFENLDDVALQVNARTLNQLSSKLDSVVAQYSETRHCILELGRAYIQFASEHPHLWTMVFEHQQPDDKDIPDWYQERINSLFGRIEQQFANLIATTTASENALAARALWSGVHGNCVLALTGKLDVVGIEDIQKTCDLLIENFLTGWVQSHG